MSLCTILKYEIILSSERTIIDFQRIVVVFTINVNGYDAVTINKWRIMSTYADV